MIPLVLIAVILILLVMIALLRAYKNEHQKNSTDLSALSAAFCISGGQKFFS